MIDPETCAMPAVITVINSESVMRGKKGRIVSGASVCPMKIDAATLRLSAPLAPMILFIATANAFTTICMMPRRSEEHTSELQSLAYLVCRLLLEKKKKRISSISILGIHFQTTLTYTRES